jgi:hypothetical protein
VSERPPTPHPKRTNPVVARLLTRFADALGPELCSRVVFIGNLSLGGGVEAKARAHPTVRGRRFTDTIGPVEGDRRQRCQQFVELNVDEARAVRGRG